MIGSRSGAPPQARAPASCSGAPASRSGAPASCSEAPESLADGESNLGATSVRRAKVALRRVQAAFLSRSRRVPERPNLLPTDNRIRAHRQRCAIGDARGGGCAPSGSQQGREWAG